MKFLRWLGYNWGNVVLALLAATIFYILLTRDDVVVPAPASKKTTEKQKAWKHWQQYWSFHDPLEDAWPHKDVTTIYYIRDHRTDLCFAVATPFGPSGFMASVPCDKVQDFIERK